MKLYLKYFLSLIAVIMFACIGYGQQFTTHTVKQGETLYSISQQYKVTPFNILKYNKEVKQDEPIQPNTLLIIRLDAEASDTSREISEDITSIIQEDSVEVEIEPISFSTQPILNATTPSYMLRL